MNKDVIESYMEEVWNKKNLKAVQSVFSESACIHSPLGQFKTPSEMSETIDKWIAAIPDIQVELLNTIEENDLVVSHWMARGTHQNSLKGIRATGNSVEYQGVSMYRFKDGKVVEYWAFLDTWTLEDQIKSSIED